MIRVSTKRLSDVWSCKNIFQKKKKMFLLIPTEFLSRNFLVSVCRIILRNRHVKLTVSLTAQILQTLRTHAHDTCTVYLFGTISRRESIYFTSPFFVITLWCHLLNVRCYIWNLPAARIINYTSRYKQCDKLSNSRQKTW